MTRGLLIPTTSGYRLLYEAAGELRADEIAKPDSEPLEAAVLRRLDELLPKGDVVLALPAAQVFAVVLPGLPKTKSTSALAFAVEVHVPWSAEDLTAQLISTGEPALAICVRTSSWLPLLQVLRTGGHAVETLAPAALMRLRGLRHGRSHAAEETWLMRDAEGMHAVWLAGDTITGWRFWPTQGPDIDDPETPALIRAELQMQGTAAALVTSGLPRSVMQTLQEAGLALVALGDEPSDDAALWADALSGGRVNLAIGELASASPLATLSTAGKQFLVSAALLMVVSAAALWWRAERWQVLADATRAQQVELFRDTFPGVSVPEAIAARLRSEHRRIVGERGGEAIPELPQSVLPGLSAALAAHAAPFRSRFEELSLDGARLELECEFRSHDEAIEMCQQLRQQGVRLESPQLHKLDETRVGARLRGKVAADESRTGAQP